MKYYLIKNTEDNSYMCVCGNFVTKKKYAMLFTEKFAMRLVKNDVTKALKAEEQKDVNSLGDRESYRLKDIPKEYLIKKIRKPRSTKFVYQTDELKIVKKEEREAERDNKRVDENYLFAILNKKCMSCQNVCKQSYKAVVLACPAYKKI